MSDERTTQIGRKLNHPVALLSGVGCAVLLLWISFTASGDLHELLLGACAAALTLALFLNLIRTESLDYRLHLRDLALVGQVPKAILKDCWILTVVLFKDLAGKERAGSYYRACGFRATTHDPVRLGREALATAFTTASPNMMVIGIDPAQSLMVFHQVKRDAVPAYAQALGAAGQHIDATPAAAGVDQ